MEIPSRSTNQDRLPTDWTDIVGPVFLKSDIGEVAQHDDGLISLETQDGLVVCPVFQFDKNENDAIVVHPQIANAWELISALQVDQLGESKWTAAGRLTASRPELDGDCWAIALRDPTIDDQTKMQVFELIVQDAVKASRRSGKTLIDPRTTLPLA